MSDAGSLTLSPFQRRILATPEGHDLFLGGGRGGGKSHAIALVILRHAEQYGRRARALYLRQTYRGLGDFENILRDVFGAVYEREARYNQSEHVWRLPGGGYVELGQLEGPGDYAKFQGRSFTLICVDEAGQYASPDVLDRMRSNLRGPSTVPLRVLVAANPGDPGHHWLSARYVFRAAPWFPFDEAKSGRRWIYCPSTYRDNTAIDQAEYRRQLEASCPSDPELLRAWLAGDWTVVRGAFFAAVLSEDRSAIAPWNPGTFDSRYRSRGTGSSIGSFTLRSAFAQREPSASSGWGVYLAHDFGVSAPSVTFVVARSPGANGPDGQWYPRDSILLLDELATSDPGSPSVGLGWTVPRLAEEIRELARRWRMPPRGVADDAIFSAHGHGAGSIADEFRACRVHFQRARKADRRTGWEIMRRMLSDAGKPDRAGLYVSRSCSYFWNTVPYLARDPRRVDDVDSRGPDHAADAARYSLLRESREWAVYELL